MRSRDVAILAVVAVLSAACSDRLATPAAATAKVHTAPPPLLRDDFDHPDGLITNEFAYRFPNGPGAVRSPTWDATSGSLFAEAHTGWTGIPDTATPDGGSTNGDGSAVFRLKSKRSDFGDVTVSLRLRVNSFSGPAIAPETTQDGFHIWLRYQSQYELYTASINRRDGVVVIKKKCVGGPTNGGTYFDIGGEVTNHPVPVGRWEDMGASVRNNANGSVTISLFRGGQLIDTADDTGIGCAPITYPGSVGMGADKTDANFDDFTVTAF